MAFNVPAQNPLTSSQSELVSKISSMKNLLNIPLFKQINIPKFQQVSMFDYLNKVMESMGIQPEVLFLVFIDRLFGAGSSFLEDTVLDGLAETLSKKGISLPNINQSGAIDAETASSFKSQNMAYFSAVMPTNFLETFKQQMAKDLALMIFGGKDSPAGEYLNPSAAERDRLINAAVCAASNFDLSNKAIVKDQDLEYNRIALKRQLEAGQVEFEINCQTIKIKLPEDPSFIFEGGGTETIEGQAVTPAQSMEVMVNYVQSQTQGINNEQNANKAGKSFFRILIEKLIGYFSTIIYAYIDPIMDAIQSTPAGVNVTKDSLLSDPCSIINDPDNQEKAEFSERILNLLLKGLLAIILLEVIKVFKRLVTNYFARTFLERQRRKAEKIKARFGMLGDVAETAEKARKFAAAASTLATIVPIPTA
jgi:hypothetical protein